MGIADEIGKRVVFFDGATGTYLQENGLGPGEFPEYWNITNRDIVIKMHKGFLEAGSDIILTNTFGANGFKFNTEEFSVKKIITAAVENAKEAIAQSNKAAYVALDIGPSGKLLKPLGDLEFEDAYNIFKEMVLYGKNAGCDAILIETMSDTYETKAAVLAAKENSSLPVFVTMVFDEKGKLLTGGDVVSTISMLEGLRVDALGINCGLGPKQMKTILKEILNYASVPVIVNPNAGLPRSVDGKTVFDVGPMEFAQEMREIVNMGAWLIGGCCGTTFEHIKCTVNLCKDIELIPILKKEDTLVSSYSKCVKIGFDPVIIGERINPTGKSKFKQALRDNDLDYILKEGLIQQEKGAHILDVNVGLPDINEVEMMQTVIKEIQSIIDLPLQIDTTNIEAMEKAMRLYNGKPMINSVNGKKESMEKVFPLIKKYGGVVVGLTLDEEGIPETSEKRLQIAKKIVDTAKEYGIDKKDIVIDVLAMTISSDEFGAITTLNALKLVRENLKVNTVLGVSNISFGLPQRDNVNSTFFTLAMQNGLTSAIINPSSEEMMKAYYSFRALKGIDSKCMKYIEKYSGQEAVKKSAQGNNEYTLSELIEKGLKDNAFNAATEMAEKTDPLEIINNELIPALDKVGKGFEKGTVFLPQLLMSAEAAKAAFEAISIRMEKSGQKRSKNGKIILATVKGDIHDIGKNIVKVLLDNYSFEVIDLGKDVAPQIIVDEVIKKDVKLVGLSALMTTTVTSMEETIKMLRKSVPGCKVMVGGAVLTQEYADMIGADNYSKDAMGSVYYAQSIFN